MLLIPMLFILALPAEIPAVHWVYEQFDTEQSQKEKD